MIPRLALTPVGRFRARSGRQDFGVRFFRQAEAHHYQVLAHITPLQL
ncbi:MAG: hypothetical protein AB7O65_08760 [Candidatus Korobacteraceae bacterium]